ncbi:GTP cyclohydrolase II [Mycetohabitans sp. B8]|uniref:GTP cyclohydrolase II n=1 Tax=Mycetohabitans sp. B8 TaxID=2841845 RepID=UPI001F0253A0|nr:GTP cyclohydrolase II [Mycetohabitans sp. B8]MCG1043002.1 GTP cyclohydrolase II [Mycetohabitans sp. B8]
MLLQCHDRSSECVTHVGKATMPTRYGNFVAHAFRSKNDNNEYLALVMGDVCQRESVLTRLHSECLTGDVLGSLRCDCGEQLDAALRSIASEGAGALLYLRGHEGRGIGLCNKILAYGLQEQGRDTVDANRDLGLPDDAREYDCAASIVRQLGILSVRLMSNNPDKFKALQRHGIPVCERVDLAIALREENERYIWAKRNRFGHYFDENELQCPLSL